MDVVKQQLNNWWGLPTSSYASQRTLLWEDIATNCIKMMMELSLIDIFLEKWKVTFVKKKAQGLGAILKDQKLSENTIASG